MSVWTPEQIGAYTAQVAPASGVDPLLALAVMDVESGLDDAAVGDHGTSFGLGMEHIGGALGSHAPSWALNPMHAIDDLVRRLAGAKSGADAAAAQRPADPTGYAAKVDSVYSQLKSAAGSASTSGGSATGDVVAAARTQLGVPYVLGGSTPGHALDCSALVQYAFHQVGVSLPRTSQAQYAATTGITAAEAQPGDLVFFNAASHVGIYEGGGRMIDAPNAHGTPPHSVREEGVWSGASYRRVRGYNGTTNVGLVSGAVHLTGKLGDAVKGVLSAGAGAVADGAGAVASAAAQPVVDAVKDAINTSGRYLLTIAVVLVAGVLLIIGLSRTVGAATAGGE